MKSSGCSKDHNSTKSSPDYDRPFQSIAGTDQQVGEAAKFSLAAAAGVSGIPSCEFSLVRDPDASDNRHFPISQDQCCPGFALTKSGKPRNQSNACTIL